MEILIFPTKGVTPRVHVCVSGRFPRSCIITIADIVVIVVIIITIIAIKILIIRLMVLIIIIVLCECLGVWETPLVTVTSSH